MLHIYTGNGKGKTTAAIGQIIRAIGHGKKVCLLQLFKSKKFYGEQKILEKIKNLKIYSFSPHHPFCSTKNNRTNVRPRTNVRYRTLVRLQCKEVMACFEKIIKCKKYDLLVLDEFNIALRDKFIELNEFLKILKLKPHNLTVVITGRSAPKRLLEIADLVTEMKEIKHPYKKGIKAKAGIEF